MQRSAYLLQLSVAALSLAAYACGEEFAVDGGSTATGGGGSTSSSSSSSSSSGTSGSTSSSSSSSSSGSSGALTGTFYVVRIGDGSGAVGSTASPVFLEHRQGNGATLGTIPMPTTPSGGNQPFTLGASPTEGSLSRSTDGKYLLLAGYATPPGTQSVQQTDSSKVNRVVARVAADGTIDTTTRFDNAFNKTSPRCVASVDGSAFWVAGGSIAGTGGVWYTTFGATSGTQLIGTNQHPPTSVRSVNITGAQLYGSSSSDDFFGVFKIGDGLPTTMTNATSLQGMPTMEGIQPLGFVFFDLEAPPGPDTLYIADERPTDQGGGVQKWQLQGTTWTHSQTFSTGLSKGVRGLAGALQGSKVVLVGTTTGQTSNHLFTMQDDGGGTTASPIATSPTNVIYAGVALAPL